MKPNLYLALYNRIEEWANEMSDGEGWPDMVYGEDTTNFMTKAAAAVFDACHESQIYGLQEGSLKKK